MDSFEFNKLAGAVLAALLAIFGTRTLVHELNHEKHLEKPGYIVEVASADASGTESGGEAAAEPDIATLLASADAGAGKKLFKKCAACHTNDAGGANRVGPNLHGIADSDIASRAGFAYSAALQGKDGNWDANALNAFLKSPKGFAKGTKMAFGGLKKPEQRANLIKYLQSLK